MLIGLTEFVELWHDAGRTAYASFTVGDHRQHWPVRSRDFRMWLSGRFYEETGGAIGGQALEDGIRILEARAVNDGPEYEPFIRVGRHGDKLFLDLCDARWRAVEITATGWSVVEELPLKFLRSSSMRPLPEPEAGGMIEELHGFLNVRSDDDFMLAVACLVAALWGRGPFRCSCSTASMAPASRLSVGSSGRLSIRALRQFARCRRTIATLWCRPAIHGCSRSTISRACRRGSPMRSPGLLPGFSLATSVLARRPRRIHFRRLEADHTQRHSVAHRPAPTSPTVR